MIEQTILHLIVKSSLLNVIRNRSYIYMERKGNEYFSLFFHILFSPWGKIGKDTFFPWEKVGLSPPPPNVILHGRCFCEKYRCAILHYYNKAYLGIAYRSLLHIMMTLPIKCSSSSLMIRKLGLKQ